MSYSNKRPNILLITTDQQRADCLGVAGHPCLHTPHIDQLAYEGVRFENAYADCPICIPARTTMITGIQAHHYGMPSYSDQYRVKREREKFLGSLITSAGYQTQLVGKTHWHTDPSFRAGFEHVDFIARLLKEQLVKTGYAYNQTGIGVNELTPGLSRLPPELHATNWIVDKSIDFLETREQGQPFFLWASFCDPHPPLVALEPYYSMYDNDDIPDPVESEWSKDDECPYAHYIVKHRMKVGRIPKNRMRKLRSVYYGMITYVDHQLGRLFGKIMRDKEWDNTLVIFTSDHGEFLGDHGSAWKTSFCESAACVPFIIRAPKWMNIKPGIVSEALVEHADILPTLCEIAGTKIPKDVTGKSLMGIVKGDNKHVRDLMHGYIDDDGKFGGVHMLHDGRYKYTYYIDDGKELLFDVSKDRNDQYPLSGEALERMRKLLVQHLSEEGHEHVQDGKLINLGRQKPPLNEVLSRTSAGLGGLAVMSNICRDHLTFHL